MAHISISLCTDDVLGTSGSDGQFQCNANSANQALLMLFICLSVCLSVCYPTNATLVCDSCDTSIHHLL